MRGVARLASNPVVPASDAFLPATGYPMGPFADHVLHRKPNGLLYQQCVKEEMEGLSGQIIAGSPGIGLEQFTLSLITWCATCNQLGLCACMRSQVLAGRSAASKLRCCLQLHPRWSAGVAPHHLRAYVPADRAVRRDNSQRGGSREGALAGFLQMHANCAVTANSEAVRINCYTMHHRHRSCGETSVRRHHLCTWCTRMAGSRAGLTRRTLFSSPQLAAGMTPRF